MIICWGCLVLDKTMPRHSGEWYNDIKLPISFNSMYNAIATVRNNPEFAVGICQPDLENITLGLTNHSDYPQHFYGIYYLAIGY